MPRSSEFSRGKRLVFGIVTFCLMSAVTLILGELVLKIFLPTSSTYLALSPGTEATFFSPFVSGVQGPSIYKVNSMGVRGREWALDRSSEYRILAVGGSTTESLMTDQSRAWTTLLEKKPGVMPDGSQIWVGNIGKSGLSTRHHILQMRHLLPVYDPDLVVLLVGVNDVSTFLKRGDRYDPHFLDNPKNLARLKEQAFAVFPNDFAFRWQGDAWFKRTRLWRLARSFKYQVLHTSLAQGFEGRSLQAWRDMRAAGRRSAKLPALDTAIEEYDRNLKQIISLIRGYGTPLLMMTQPALWRADLTKEEKALLWMGGVGDFQTEQNSLYYTPEALAMAMNAYNERLLSVCQETGVKCLDLARLIPKTTAYFYDDCHFTDKTHVLIADAVADAILRIGKHSTQPTPADHSFPVRLTLGVPVRQSRPSADWRQSNTK